MTRAAASGGGPTWTLFPPQRFARRWGVVATTGTGDTPAGTDAATFAAMVHAHRLGGPPDLPDPGHAALAVARHGAILVLDPCTPRPDAAARAAVAARLGIVLTQAVARAAGRPVLVLPHPSAPHRARPALVAWPGARVLPHRLASWTLLDAAAEIHLVAPAPGEHDPIAALAGAAAIPLFMDGQARDATAAWIAALAATVWTCPFHGTPIAPADGLALLAQWRMVAAQNRRVAAITGIPVWKRASLAPLFAHARGTPAFRAAPGAALKRAEKRHGALVAWASAMPPALPAAAAAAGVPLLRLEDGFVRGAGLGARFLPGASWCLDSQGVHYDPAAPSDLEALLQAGGVPAAVLARAAALRDTIVRRGVSKYNLAPHPAPALPAGRRIVLVTGQVEDDASMRAVTGAVRSNLALLRAVRAAEPDGYILYKPHPDLVAGYRHGRIAQADLVGLADAVETATPLPGLLPHVHALHTITSLSGFEALLRGVPVICWGQPAYAGWGLTEDRDPIPRRTRRLTLDELVAGMLILYPRYLDPVTRLPCGPEILLDRLGDASLWRGSPWAVHREVQGFVTRFFARLRRLS
ncbi:capsule biosynthesis protein [Humitalea sp. 24SJ18S-53]|uniref:capsular polysaccharide export protein, LipB/KpsS family n=1 Tax=Humitalea sp. 24SJ18S-53 TaxID=3422307 RepID=UPI003D6651DF